MFSESIRRYTYWILDFLKGAKVRKHYNDIKNIMEDMGSIERVKVQQKYLTQLIEDATNNVEFYKKYDGITSIDEFPVINKNTIKDNYDLFQSIRYKDAKVFNMHTSGSTGTPFVVRQDSNKRNRVLAEMMYFWGKAGYQIGMKYVFFRVWTDVNKKNKLMAIARNLEMCDILSLNQENLESIRQMLKSNHKIKMLLGYASTFENLANYLKNCGDTPDMFGVEVIISGSEVLSETVREKLKEVFGCKVVSLYSNQENGMIAQECNDGKEFHVNEASFYIELLKLDSDEKVGIGEEGRIVITDLFNYAMPLIRYDTGDIGIWKDNKECSWDTKILESIQGRKVDFIYDTKGNKLSPHTITNYMWPFDKLLQFQFIQESSNEYVLRLNGAKEHYQDSQLIDVMKGILGNDANIVIEHVEEIPVLKSGKFKKVICNYQQEEVKNG